jgi:prepilin-type N-terminal cleavage/methylation domain-containing protein
VFWPWAEEKMKGTASAQKGFTLVEAIIVILILSIVTAIAIPEFRKMAVNANLKAAARDLIADFSSLKQMAISGDVNLGNRMYRISLNVATKSYQLQRCTNQGSPCLGWAQMQAKNFMAFGNDIDFRPDDTTVTNYNFRTRGTVTNGTIVLTNSRNSTATITVNIAGRTYVQFDLK